MNNPIQWFATKKDTLFYLPEESEVGTQIEIIAMPNTWILKNKKRQQIKFGNKKTSPTIHGYVRSTSEHSGLKIVCVVKDKLWCVVNARGDLKIK